MNKDQIYMQRAIDLAKNGLGFVSPNPMVGSVVVYNDKIIGEGYHQKLGEHHAEVNAIKAVFNNYGDKTEELLSKSIIYITLEPCSHQGKTPPCVNMILKYKIPKVVIGTIDLFEKVKGKSIEMLKDAGVEVVCGVLEDSCIELNKRFLTYHLKHRPYIILKWAKTQNDVFAPKNNTQYWITSKRSKQLTHKWRHEEDAIMVGKNTAKIDNPQLTVREWTGNNPVRIVIDQHLELSKELSIFDNQAKTIVYNEHISKKEDNITYISIEFNKYLPQFIMYQLYLSDIQSVIIEGGANLLNQFIDSDLWDEARVFTGKDVFILDGIAAPKINKPIYYQEEVDTDLLTIYINN